MLVTTQNLKMKGKNQCPFYKELEECYGYKPNVKPLFILRTHKDEEVKNTEEESKAESTLSDCDETPDGKSKDSRMK